MKMEIDYVVTDYGDISIPVLISQLRKLENANADTAVDVIEVLLMDVKMLKHELEKPISLMRWFKSFWSE